MDYPVYFRRQVRRVSHARRATTYIRHPTLRCNVANAIASSGVRAPTPTVPYSASVVPRVTLEIDVSTVHMGTMVTWWMRSVNYHGLYHLFALFHDF